MQSSGDGKLSGFGRMHARLVVDDQDVAVSRLRFSPGCEFVFRARDGVK